MQVMVSKKSQVKKHIHKSSFMMCLHTLTTDQSESTFNVGCVSQQLVEDLNGI
jgi:hypothetical protein